MKRLIAIAVFVCVSAFGQTSTAGKMTGTFSPVILYTYYVDPVNGSDANPGTSSTAAWKTTTPADSVTLTGGASVAYLYAGQWVLYRKIGMLSNQTTLPTNLITAPSNKF